MPQQKRNQFKHTADDARKRYTPNRFRFSDSRLAASSDPYGPYGPDDPRKPGKPGRSGRPEKSQVSKGDNSGRNSSNILNIKWNSLDGLISIIVLVAILVGIYFGTSKLISVLNVKRLLNLNISSIDSLTFSIFYGIQVLLMLGSVWFFAIYWRRSRIRDLGFCYYSIPKTIWYTFLSLVLIFIVSFVYVLILQKVFGIHIKIILLC